MIKSLFALAVVVLLNGCYTQLMTYSAYPVVPVRDSLATVQDSSQGERVHPEEDYRQYGCNCTPYEITAGLCWCVCDRCGHYHRFGYQYCPTGWYSSYWGWDYYQDYPYWYDSYQSNQGRYNYNNRDHYYSGSGGGGPSSALPKAEKTPFVGDRKSHHAYLNSSPGPASENPAPKPAVNATPPPSSPSPAPAPAPAAQPDTAKPNTERPMNRNRLR